MIQQYELLTWGIKMIQLINTMLIGVTSGGIYALMAISMVLVWRSTRVINFAQAGMALLSTYFGYEAMVNFDSFWIALPVAMAGGALFAAIIEVALTGEAQFKWSNCKCCSNHCNIGLTRNYSRSSQHDLGRSGCSHHRAVI
jgi:hypothetical protein